jgi:hypothetical protein
MTDIFQVHETKFESLEDVLAFLQHLVTQSKAQYLDLEQLSSLMTQIHDLENGVNAIEYEKMVNIEIIKQIADLMIELTKNLITKKYANAIGTANEVINLKEINNIEEVNIQLTNERKSRIDLCLIRIVMTLKLIKRKTQANPEFINQLCMGIKEAIREISEDIDDPDNGVLWVSKFYDERLSKQKIITGWLPKFKASFIQEFQSDIQFQLPNYESSDLK